MHEGRSSSCRHACRRISRPRSWNWERCSREQNLAIISKVRAAEKVKPKLELGGQGRLRGESYSIIGDGIAVGDSEEGAFWTAFLRSLKARGLHGVKLVISDAHEGLKAAIGSVFLGASWQRCRVHFMRNVLAKVPRATPR